METGSTRELPEHMNRSEDKGHPPKDPSRDPKEVGTRFLDPERFERLLTLLVERGHRLIGPTLREGVIVYDTIEGVGDLPRGVREEHGPGYYRTEQTSDDRLFAWAHGPDSAKRFLFPPSDE